MGHRGRRSVPSVAASLALLLTLTGCEYFKLLRPNALKQLSPDMVRLVNYLPDVDDPNEAIVARLFAHGGLSHADEVRDGVMRDEIWVPKNEFIWRPSIIVMDEPGELVLDIHNTDQNFHIAFMPSNGVRQVLELPRETAGRISIRLDQPGLYWFGCPVGNHAGRGMLGLVIVEGPTPETARLDRPEQPD